MIRVFFRCWESCCCLVGASPNPESRAELTPSCSLFIFSSRTLRNRSFSTCGGASVGSGSWRTSKQASPINPNPSVAPLQKFQRGRRSKESQRCGRTVSSPTMGEGHKRGTRSRRTKIPNRAMENGASKSTLLIVHCHVILSPAEQRSSGFTQSEKGPREKEGKDSCLLRHLLCTPRS